jgi:hypothetical protein
VSSQKHKAKSSVNQQVKAGISAVREFLAGRTGEAKAAVTEDKATREVVAAELLAAMSGRGAEVSRGNAQDAAPNDTQEIPRFEAEAAGGSLHGAADRASESNAGAMPSDNVEERQRARELFLDHGYFDEAVQELRTANSPAQRAAAARALGLCGSQRGTAHLIAAMFDVDPEVRTAAEEALNRIGDPTVADVPANAVSNNEISLEEPAKVSPVQSATADATSAPASAVQDVIQTVEPDVAQVEHVPSEAGEAVSPATTSRDTEATEAQLSETTAAKTGEPDLTAIDASAIGEDEQLLLEEHRIREEAEALGHQLLELTAARKKAEQEIELRTEREAKLRQEAAAQRRKEEKLRKQADEEAARLRTQEREAVAVELAARVEAETEAQRLVEEEIALRLKTTSMRQAGEELARQRVDNESACWRLRHACGPRRKRVFAPRPTVHGSKLNSTRRRRHNCDCWKRRAAEQRKSRSVWKRNFVARLMKNNAV